MINGTTEIDWSGTFWIPASFESRFDALNSIDLTASEFEAYTTATYQGLTGYKVST